MNNKGQSSVIESFGTVEKGADKKIDIRLMEYNGTRYLDLRTFERREGDKWVFTNKGITLGVKTFDVFMKLMSGQQEVIEIALSAEVPDA